MKTLKKEETRIRKQRVLDALRELKKGLTSSEVNYILAEKYNISPATAKDYTREASSRLKESMVEIQDDVAAYLTQTLIGDIEHLANKDNYRDKLRAEELLAKVSHVFDDKPSVTVINSGFKFGVDDDQPTSVENK